MFIDSLKEVLRVRLSEAEAETRRLEGDLERANREVMTLKERLEKEKHSVIQQLDDALQLIQDLEQEIRHNAKGRRGGDPSETSMADLEDRVAMDCMPDQADSQLGRTETTPAVLRPDIGAQSSASSLADSNISNPTFHLDLSWSYPRADSRLDGCPLPCAPQTGSHSLRRELLARLQWPSFLA